MASGTSLPRLVRPSICSSCRQSMRQRPSASFATTARRAEDDPKPSPSRRSSASNAPQQQNLKVDTKHYYEEMSSMLTSLSPNVIPKANRSPSASSSNLLSNILEAQSSVPTWSPSGSITYDKVKPKQSPHHLHIYAHKHNTHIVLTRPNREPILSFSAGNIGFRKAQRGSFDAAFQLAAYVMRTISDKGLLRNQTFAESSLGSSRGAAAKGLGGRTLESPIRTLEVVLRGFGKGREAVTKALLGTEGRGLREKIVAVSDDTKLKFGGTRSPNPRRLG